MSDAAVVVVSIGAVLAVLVGLAIVDSRMLPATSWQRSAAITAGCAGVGVAVWLAMSPFVLKDAPGYLYPTIAALGGLAAFLVTLAVRATGAGIAPTLTFAFVWSAAVFVPTAAITFSVLPWPFELNPIDHGGSLAVNVATGAAILGVLLAGGAGAGRARSAIISRNSGVAGVLLLTLGWIVWLGSVEFAVDDVTLAITVNSIIGGAGGIVGWLAVQRIRHQRTTVDAVAAGLVSGLVSITAGAALFTPAFAVIAGVLSGAAACAFTLNRVAASRRQQWFLVGSHLIAGATGLVILGVFATGIGFVFTGQLVSTGEQAASAALVAAYSAGVSFLLWSAMKIVIARGQAISQGAP